MKDHFYEEIMKKALTKCIDDGEYYEFGTDNSTGFALTDGANSYLSEVGGLARNICHMLSKEYVIDD